MSKALGKHGLPGDYRAVKQRIRNIEHVITLWSSLADINTKNSKGENLTDQQIDEAVMSIGLGTEGEPPAAEIDHDVPKNGRVIADLTHSLLLVRTEIKKEPKWKRIKLE